MPARFNQRKKHRIGGRKPKSSFNPLLKVIFLLVIILGLSVFIFASGAQWNGKDKLVLAIKSSDEEVNLVVFDPRLSEVTSISIPGNTEVEAAESLGKWRLRSVWQLGEQEGLGGGDLLVRTITKHFKFPVYLWASDDAMAFSDPTPGRLFKAAFFPYATNLSWRDKLGLAFFSLSIKNPKRVNIDLSETSYLKKKLLVDGEEGYVISSSSIPQSLSSIFTDPEFSETTPYITIKDKTGEVGLAEEVGRILEVMGGKVSSLEREKEEDVQCAVRGREKKLVERIVNLFPCSAEQSDTGSFDLEIILGGGFAKRY